MEDDGVRQIPWSLQPRGSGSIAVDLGVCVGGMAGVPALQWLSWSVRVA